MLAFTVNFSRHTQINDRSPKSCMLDEEQFECRYDPVGNSTHFVNHYHIAWIKPAVPYFSTYP